VSSQKNLPFLATLNWRDWQTLQSDALNLIPSFDHLVVVGIGGSSLGAKAIVSALGLEQRVSFLENPDPDIVRKVLDRHSIKRTLFQIVSKSGETLETLAHFFYLWDYVEKSGGNPKQQFIVTTDPEKGFLRQCVQTYRLKSYSIPSFLGGRFSVFSPVGLFAAAFSGVSLEELFEGAQTTLQTWEKDPSSVKTSAQQIYDFYNLGRDIMILFPYQQRLYPLAQWMAQLIAESLGKKKGKTRVGITPIVRLGPEDQHSQLQLYLEGPQDKWVQFLWMETDETLRLNGALGHEKAYLHGKSYEEILQAELQATRDTLSSEGVPNHLWTLPKPHAKTLGSFMLSYQLVTVTLAEFLGVNPYDQPAVEQIKERTREYLSSQ